MLDSTERRQADFGGLPAIGDRIANVPFNRITGEPMTMPRMNSCGWGISSNITLAIAGEFAIVSSISALITTSCLTIGERP